MKLIIAGTRHFPAARLARTLIPLAVRRMQRVFGLDDVALVLCGERGGADTAGAIWARREGIHIREFEPTWVGNGRAAGTMRNARMVSQADALLLIWDGRSAGSADTLRKALAKGLPVMEVILAGEGTRFVDHQRAAAQLGLFEEA